ncbi:MAG: hypothetical protein ABSB69_18765 [Solirubrobacteraceae bacterium]
MRRPAVLVSLLLAVGLASTLLAVRSREGDSLLVAQQQDLNPVRPAALQMLLLTTSDPRPGHRGRARDASCVLGGSDALGDPWVCVVRYPRPPGVRYEVVVHGDGSISGSGRPVGTRDGTALTVSGCCLAGF